MQAGHQGVGGFGPAVGFQLATGFGLGPFGEVGAGTEAAALADQHHHAHGRVGFMGVQQRMQGFQGGNVQRVALLRAVQGDPGDAGFDLAVQGGHGSPRLVVFGDEAGESEAILNECSARRQSCPNGCVTANETPYMIVLISIF
ncbi:hypothetical protein D3C78_1365700 [compost metagenome]